MLSWLSKKVLNLCGWQIIGQPPQINKYVIVVAPHTSNWDFFIFLLLKFHCRLRVNFIGKHTIFIGPIGWLLKKLGGIPVERTENHNMVDSISQAFNNNKKMIFALSPEGTRSYHDYWRSGFYHIALKAKVPVQLCFLDRTNNTLGFGPLINLSGDQTIDLATLNEFYNDKKGIRAELFSKIKFKE